MKTFYQRVDARGRITLPHFRRKLLDLHPRDEVVVAIEDDGSVTLKKNLYTLESIRGSIPDIPNSTPDLDKEIEEAMEEHYRDRYPDLFPRN